MKILQIVTTYGQNCGIAVFAGNLHKQMANIGSEVETVATVNDGMKTKDIILLHYHSELLSDEDVISLCKKTSCPVVLFAHSCCGNNFNGIVAGFVAMCSGMLLDTTGPVHIFPHPAWTPEYLEDRTILRNRYGIPNKSMIIGTNGFLKFERQLCEILTLLLPHAKENDWFVDVIASPWYIDSPGLISQLESLQSIYSAYFRFENTFLDGITLNHRLQACDLLWCWTKAPSSPYASGVISDQYASGTRIFAADKLQHSHVLTLPNVVRGSDQLEDFVEQLIAEISCGIHQRHNPAPISWDRCINKLAFFLAEIQFEKNRKNLLPHIS